MQRVAERMTLELATLPSNARVAEARVTCSSRGVSHLVITDNAHGLVGVLCTCDLREAPLSAPVQDHMAKRVITVRPEASVREAARLMRDNHVGCLPVVEDGKLVGIITPSDLRDSSLPPAEKPETLVCACCGSTEHVRPAEHEGCATFCLDCLERSRAAS